MYSRNPLLEFRFSFFDNKVNVDVEEPVTIQELRQRCKKLKEKIENPNLSQSYRDALTNKYWRYRTMMSIMRRKDISNEKLSVLNSMFEKL